MVLDMTGEAFHAPAHVNRFDGQKDLFRADHAQGRLAADEFEVDRGLPRRFDQFDRDKGSRGGRLQGSFRRQGFASGRRISCCV